jgi:hypothetical protein
MTIGFSEAIERSAAHSLGSTEGTTGPAGTTGQAPPVKAQADAMTGTPLSGAPITAQLLSGEPASGQPGRPVSANQMLGYIAVIVVLSIGYFAMVLISMNASTPRLTATQTMDPPAQPFWIKNLPFAPRGGAPSDLAPISQSGQPRPAAAQR